MSNELKSLSSQSYEAEIVLKNFATRKRVHKDKPIDVLRLYHAFTLKGLKLNVKKFDEVFTKLEQFGHGKVIRASNGSIRMFEPSTNIKAIGMEAMDVLQPVSRVPFPVTAPIVHKLGLPTIKVAKEVTVGEELVTIVIIKNGQSFEAKVPASKREEFIKMLA